ncbi:uncharacterized protein DUF4873 [Blastococcus colisei]|uniref:Uncharacterized protein DUF4873 n=1 Tax=Blastococcus colisei TaxID=1564162 RepID=A0A543PGI3_9ACTN|nr:DUF4873 domain-containing protein [Blastococcus colisei]TQN43185.1 uncharacterized protein DUF4873 [Blastococcus colisei]
MSGHEEPEGYDGEVTLALEGEPPRAARAALAARFDPLAGHVVWSGRVATDLPARTALVLSTPHGSAAAEATERDAWGNTRISGLGRPPFPVELLDGDGEGLARD